MRTCIQCRRATLGSAVSNIIGDGVCFFSELCARCAKTITLKKKRLSCRMCARASKALIDGLCKGCGIEFKKVMAALPSEAREMEAPLGHFLLEASKKDARKIIHDRYDRFPLEGAKEQ